MNNLTEIDELVRNCQDCPLGLTRTKAVPGEGPADAQIILIAEGPGKNEDEQGRPFVGAAGTFLEELLDSAGMNREDLFITNMIKCRAPDNRDPQPTEMEACRKYLDRQIELINPDLIVTLGSFSTQKFIHGEKISKARGRLRRINGRTILPIIHPAAGLRRNEMRQAVQQDFRNLPAQLQMAQNYPPEEEPQPEPVETTTAKTADPSNSDQPAQQSLF